MRIANTKCPGTPDCISNAADFVSELKKMLIMFQAKRTSSSGSDANAVIYKVGTLTKLVSGGAHEKCGLSVQEAVNKRWSLPSLLELKCMNCRCPT